MSEATFFVGMPAYRGVETATARSLLELVLALDAARTLDGRFELLGAAIVEGYGCARNSEDAALAAIRAGADALLHVDADMSFSPADVLRLLDTWSEDRSATVGAMYPSSRGGPYVGALEGVPAVDGAGEPCKRGSFTSRTAAAAVAMNSGLGPFKASILGFGLIVIPVRNMALLQADRGYVFHEGAMGRSVEGVDSTYCRTAEAKGWPLVAELRCKAKHLQRTWE